MKSASNSPTNRPIWTVSLTPEVAAMFNEGVALIRKARKCSAMEARSVMANACIRSHLKMLSDNGEMKTFQSIECAPPANRKAQSGSKGGAR